MGARKEKADRFRLILDAAPNAIVASDEQGRIVLVNAQTERLFGYRRDELLGQSVDILVPPRFRAAHPAARASFHADPRTRPMGAGRDLFGLHKDGSEFPVEIGLNPVQTDGGLLVLSAIVDITERKRAEEALREADRRKDEFLAMLAHELRNPLAPVANAVEILAHIVPAEPRVKWATELVQRQVRHMSRLVDDLLDVSRITRGKVTIRKEDVPIDEVIRRAVETAQPLIEARHHRLDVKLPAETPRIEGDLTRLAQVVGNLLTNAAKFTDDGGLIQVRVETSGGEAVVRVKDNGRGIPREMLPTVFDLFTQADQTLDRSQGGLGIGLTLVRKLVELHGGTVEARSGGPGTGSEFVVRLPLDASARPQRATDTRDQPHGRRRRVLVVDDNADAVQSLVILLQMHGYEVTSAATGTEALEAAHRAGPEVVILDIGLPDLNGFEVARLLRADRSIRQPELIALTGYGREQDREQAKAAGFDHYFTKPADPKKLYEVLDAD